MLKATVNSGAYTVDTNVPLTLYKNTNVKTVLNSDSSISLLSTGIKDVKANIVFSPTALGTVTLTMYANGVAVPGAIYTQTIDAGDYGTFIINDALKVARDYFGNVATISFRLSAAGTLAGGSVIVEHVS